MNGDKGRTVITLRHPYHNRHRWSMHNPALDARRTTFHLLDRILATCKALVPIVCLAVSLQNAVIQETQAQERLVESGIKPILTAAEQAYTAGSFKEAVRLCSRAEKEVGPDAKIYRMRGSAYEMLDENRNAVEDYKAALRLDSQDYRSMESLGGIYEKHEKYIPEAIILYKRAAELDPRPAWREKLATWQAVLESRFLPETSSAVACWHLGNEKARKGKSDEAETYYSQAVKLNPKMFQAYYSRGLLWLHRDDPLSALADFEQALNLAPEFAQAYLYRGTAYEQLGDTKQALKDFGRAARLDPRDPAILYRIGCAVEGENDPGTALELYETALKLRPSSELAFLIKEKINGLKTLVKPRKRNRSGSLSQKTLW